MGEPLLLVVDMQNEFINEHTARIIPHIIRLLPKYKHVAATYMCQHPVENFSTLLQWSMDSHSATSPAIIMPKNTLAVEKTGYNGFTKDIQNYVTQHGIHDIHLCGVDTDACIMATALSLFDANLRPVILKDACASSGGHMLHQNAIQILRRCLGHNQVT